jgi:hypothetical protein
MTEFKAGEYTMRNGEKAVVLVEIPETTGYAALLIGYADTDTGYQPLTWRKDGRKRFCGDKDSLDLMPNKRKIEQWIFSWSNHKAHYSIPSRGVQVGDTLGEAEEEKRALMECGYICSEIVHAPVLEIEE